MVWIQFVGKTSQTRRSVKRDTSLFSVSWLNWTLMIETNMGGKICFLTSKLLFERDPNLFLAFPRAISVLSMEDSARPSHNLLLKVQITNICPNLGLLSLVSPCSARLGFNFQGNHKCYTSNMSLISFKEKEKTWLSRIQTHFLMIVMHVRLQQLPCWCLVGLRMDFGSRSVPSSVPITVPSSVPNSVCS